MSRKLIVTDIDGTFLKSDRTLHPENVRAVKELLAQGHYFALATGRIYGTARMIAHHMGMDMFIISNNGASIRHTSDPDPLFESIMPESILERVFAVAERHGYLYQVYTDMEMVAAQPNRFLQKYVEELQSIPPHMRYHVEMNGDPRRVKGVRKVAFTFYDKPPTPELFSEVRAVPGVVAEQSHRFGLDISLSGVDKGSALTRLAGFLNVRSADTIAFGDEENDVVLMEAAGLGVAVANAAERTKASAMRVTVSNDEAGFASFLREIL